MREMDLNEISSNDAGVFSSQAFTAYQELLVESHKKATNRDNKIVNQHLHVHTNVSTVLTTAVPGDGTTYELAVADSTGFLVGDYIHINTTSVETTHPQIKAISAATGPAVFTLDRRIDSAHAVGDAVIQAILDLKSIAGTLLAPVEYYAGPPAGEVWTIHRLLFSMGLSSAGDLGLFGNLGALPNGVLLRVRQDGVYTTFSNWKINADIKADMYDVDFDQRSGGGGTHGISGKGAFTDIGATVRLDGSLGDQIEVYIQDNLTTLVLFEMKIQGVVE